MQWTGNRTSLVCLLILWLPSCCILYHRRRLYDVSDDIWAEATEDMQLKMARMAASASWGLGHWPAMDEYTCMIPGDTYDGAFYRSVIAVHNNHFDVAQQVKY